MEDVVDGELGSNVRLRGGRPWRCDGLQGHNAGDGVAPAMGW